MLRSLFSIFRREKDEEDRQEERKGKNEKNGLRRRKDIEEVRRRRRRCVSFVLMFVLVANMINVGYVAAWSLNPLDAFGIGEKIKEKVGGFLSEHRGAIAATAGLLTFAGCELAVSASSLGVGAVPGAMACGAVAATVSGTVYSILPEKKEKAPSILGSDRNATKDDQ